MNAKSIEKVKNLTSQVTPKEKLKFSISTKMSGTMKSFVFLACLLATGLVQGAAIKSQEEADYGYVKYSFRAIFNSTLYVGNPDTDPSLCIYVPPGTPDCVLHEKLRLPACKIPAIPEAQQGTTTQSVDIRPESKVFRLQLCKPVLEYTIPICNATDPVKNADVVYETFTFASAAPADCRINAYDSVTNHLLCGPNKRNCATKYLSYMSAVPTSKE